VATAVPTTAWLRRYHPADPGDRRLVCFPHAGGSASFYHPVSARFSPGVEVVAVQYPGRQDRRREPCVDDIRTLAGLVAAEIRALPPKPSVYFGHSMGAAVAFETAWRLERDGLGPRALIASGWRAPSDPLDEGVHRRDDDGVFAEIRGLDGTDAALLADEEILRMALPAIRSDYRAIETYAASRDQVLRCPIITLLGDTDGKVDRVTASGWAAHTNGAFRLRVFPGGHFYLLGQQAQVCAEVAATLADHC
jgi:surfactin synthase thioesterase subunit